jgi:phosphate-selective porin OprO/OprP
MSIRTSRPHGPAGKAAFRLAIYGVCAAAGITLVTAPASAEDNKVLERLGHLENRIDTLETGVKTRDSKIQELENQVKQRDAKIQNMQSGQAAAATSAAQIQPAAGQPADEQRIDNLERTVRQLNEITNAQAEELAKPKGPKVTTKGGLTVESEDGQFSFQPFGRLHYDAAFYDQDKSKMGDGMQLRRARLGMTGKMFGDWMYKVEADFGRDTGAGTVGVKEAWIKYIGLNPAEFLVGNVPVPFGLEQYTSDNFITFIERALPSPVFAPERLLGGVGGYYGPNWSFAAGGYGRSVDSSTNLANEGDQQFVSTARLTYEPILEKDKLIHLGLGFLFENPSDAALSFSTKPESNVTAVKFLNTGAISNVDHLFEIDPELALVYGPASFQGEYFWVPVTRTQPGGTTSSPSVDLTGWYAQVSYFLTGESRNFNPKIARFDRVTPFHNVGHDGGWGAVELAARVSNLNLDNGPHFQFGDETDYTLGLNWYMNPYIRFMANYIWIRNNASATGNSANLLPGHLNDGYDDPRIFEIRAQVDF